MDKSNTLMVIKRKTKAFQPNVNGYLYTEEAFNDAMERYLVESGGVVYITDDESVLISTKEFIDPKHSRQLGYIEYYSDENLYVRLINGMEKFLDDDPIANMIYLVSSFRDDSKVIESIQRILWVIVHTENKLEV